MGQARAATLKQEVISGVDRLEGDHSDLKSVTGDKDLSHKASRGRHSTSEVTVFCKAFSKQTSSVS